MYNPYIPPELQPLIDESCAIKWLIYINGGNASKSTIEDVLMVRHPEIDHFTAHEAQNLIEYHCLIQQTFIMRQWNHSTPEPSLTDYPEIDQLTKYPVKWYRGNPYHQLIKEELA